MVLECSLQGAIMCFAKLIAGKDGQHSRAGVSKSSSLHGKAFFNCRLQVVQRQGNWATFISTSGLLQDLTER